VTRNLFSVSFMEELCPLALTVARAILCIGQELSVKPFSLLSTNRASLAHGGPRGGPADDERHHQNLKQEVFL
jgi:hypothetical protein